MLPLRRVALRALAARPSTSFLLSNSSRTIVTCRPQNYQTQHQWGLSRLQKRFASDEAKPEQSTATSETVTESVSEPAQEVAEEAAPDSQAEAVSSQPIETAPASTTDSTAPATPSVRDPVQAEQQATQEGRVIFIGNMFFESTPEDLREWLGPFGEIESAKVIYDPRGLSKGFGFVTFKTAEEAQAAIAARNEEVFHGRRVTVQINQPKPRPERGPRKTVTGPTSTLYIGNMSFEMSDKDLNDLFREVRNIRDVRVAVDRQSGQPRGFAHADFYDVESAVKAKEQLQGREIYGRTLRVDFGRAVPLRRTPMDRPRARS